MLGRWWRALRPVDWALLALSLALWSVLQWHALARLRTVHHVTFDLALYTRIAWGSVRGLLYSPLLDQNFLTAHCSFALPLLGAIGALWGNTAQVLLTAQALCLTAAAFPLAAIGRRHFGDSGALATAALWWLQPNLSHTATYEFHPGSLAMLPLCAALSAWDRGDDRALLRWSAVVVACRADFALLTLMLGVLRRLLPGTPSARRPPSPRVAPAGGDGHESPPTHATPAGVCTTGQGGPAVPGTPVLDATGGDIASERGTGAARGLLAALTLRPGATLVLGSLGYFALVVVALPMLLGLGPPGGASADAHFGHFGGSPLGVIPLLLREPAAVLAHFSAPERLTYLPRVLWPLGLLPLLSPAPFLVALPPLAVNLLSQFPTVTAQHSHYLTAALPALTVAAVRGASVLPRFVQRPALWAAVACALLANLQLGALPFSRTYPAAAFSPDSRTFAARTILDAIPDDAAVQAPYALLPHLAERQTVHRPPPPERAADYVVLDVSHRRRFFGNDTVLRTDEEPVARDVLAKDSAVIAVAGDLLLLQRHRDPRSGVVKRYLRSSVASTTEHAVRLTACLRLVAAGLDAHTLRLSLRADGPCDSDLAVRYGDVPRPQHGGLLFDGVLSPVHLRAGDTLLSEHPLPPALAAALARAGRVYVGVLRQSGAPPTHDDPYTVAIALTGAGGGPSEASTREVPPPH